MSQEEKKGGGPGNFIYQSTYEVAVLGHIAL